MQTANHKIDISTNVGGIGPAFKIEYPLDYEVDIKATGRKGHGPGIGLQLADFFSLVVSLQQVGLLDWTNSQAYLELWQYIAKVFSAVHFGPMRPSTKFVVQDSKGAEVRIEGITPDNLSQASILVKEIIEKNRSESVIKIDFGK